MDTWHVLCTTGPVVDANRMRPSLPSVVLAWAASLLLGEHAAAQRGPDSAASVSVPARAQQAAAATAADGKTPAPATTPDGRSRAIPALSLSEALTYAARHQPSLRAAQARIEVARRSVSVAYAEWLPQLGATAQLFGGTMNNSTAMFSSVRTMDLPRIGGSKSPTDVDLQEAYPSTLVGIGLRQTVFDFGRIAAQVALADHEVRIASHRAELEQLELGLAVESAYYAVLAAKAVERAAQEAYARAVLRMELVQAGVARGLRPPIDLTRAEVDRTRFDVGQTRARGNIELAQAQLAAVVGWTEPLLDAQDVEPADEQPPPLLGEAFQRAIDTEPMVRVAVARLVQQQTVTRQALMQWMPSLQLTASVSGRAGGAPLSSGPSGFSGWVPEVANWDVGLVLSVPILDGVLIAKRNQSHAQEEVLRHEVDAAKRQVLTNVTRAFTGFQLARESLRALRSAASAARKNYDQASARFRSGLASGVELADAEALRTEADIQLAMGRFEIARSRALFQRALAAGL